LQIEEITSLNDFYSIRHDWNQLINGITDNTFFLCWERIASAVEHLEEGSELKIILIRDCGELLGIIPLKKRIRYINGIVAYSIIKSISNRAPGILLKKRKSECLNLLLSHLYSQKDWDSLTFEEIPETFSFVDLIRLASGVKFEITEGDVSPYLRIPDSKSALYANISPSFRHNLRNDLRRLQKRHGEVTLKEYYEIGSLEEMMNQFFQLHGKRWSSKGQKGAFDCQQNRDIFLTEAKYLAEINCLKLYFLLLKGEPISAFYGYTHNQVLYYLLGGFDPAYATYGPNNLQLLNILERCVENNFKELNFFSGFTEHKFRWCKLYRKTYNLKFFNTGAHSAVLKLADNFATQSYFGKKLAQAVWNHLY
jgi:CelD/BcsL family acetyltransferase involved in cellulose biosynthesis